MEQIPKQCPHPTPKVTVLATHQTLWSSPIGQEVIPYANPYLDCTKIKLSAKCRTAACFIQPVITSIWGIWLGISVISINLLKIEKWPTSAAYQNAMMTKKLPPSGEATHNTINMIVSSLAVWSAGSFLYIMGRSLTASYHLIVIPIPPLKQVLK